MKTDFPNLGVELSGRRLALLGRFAAVSEREAAEAIARQGGTIDSDAPELVVVGDFATNQEREAARELAAGCGAGLIEEATFWRGLGLTGLPDEESPGYSAASLADLVGVPVSTIRRWIRRGLLRPQTVLGELGVLDFTEARIAKSLAGLLKAGVTLAAIERGAEQLALSNPSVPRPFATMPVRAIGGEIVVAEGEREADPTGQRRLTFDEQPPASDTPGPPILRMPDSEDPVVSLRRRAWRLYDAGDVEAAVEAWRLTMLEVEPTADDHFVLAEWLAESSHEEAARERLYTALELDDRHVEARIALARSLWKSGDAQLAIATLQGALQDDPDNAELHFELSQLVSAGDTGSERLAETPRLT